MESSSGTYVKVGIFTLLALAIGVVLVFTIGSGHELLGRRAKLHTSFINIGGLKPGGPVRIGGLDVGTVDSVVFRSDRRVHVTFEVDVDALAMLRTDSVAHLGNKGLLGDRLLDLDTGSRGGAVVDGATLPSEEPADLFGTAQRLSGRAEGVIENARTFSGALADPQFTADLRSVAHDLTTITHQLAQGQGTAGRLLRDEQLGRDVAEGAQGLSVAARQLAAAASDVRSVTHEIRHGHGSAHDIIYGDEAARLFADLAGAASELRQALAQIREGDGGMHELVYGQEGQTIVHNLAEATDSLQTILAGIEAGRGTIGGLLVDPSIYEDVKRLVGDLERNDVLRALVRYSITEDERRPTAGEPHERDER